jgi:nucleoside-diphosphate-sugar epimerase
VGGLTEAVRTGRWAWFDHGANLTSTCHVDNLIEAMLLASERGRGGEIYFVTDGTDRTYREHFSAVMARVGVELPGRSFPLWLAYVAAKVMETVYRGLSLSSTPPINRTEVCLIGQEMTVCDQKIRTELGYVGHVTWEDGLDTVAHTLP